MTQYLDENNGNIAGPPACNNPDPNVYTHDTDSDSETENLELDDDGDDGWGEGSYFLFYACLLIAFILSRIYFSTCLLIVYSFSMQVIARNEQRRQVILELLAQ